MHYRPTVTVLRAVLVIVPHLDKNGMAAVLAGKEALPLQREAEIDIELAAVVIPAGGRNHVKIIHKLGDSAAAREGVELPNCRPRGAVQREGDFIGRQSVNLAEEKIASVDVQAVSRNLGFGDCAAGDYRVIHQQTGFLDERRLGVGQERMELQRIQVDIASGQNVEMNMVEAVIKRFHRPINDFAQLCIWQDKASVLMVSLPGLIGLMDG